MKKYFLILIPIGLWIACYFIWTSAETNWNPDSISSLWWAFTSLFSVIITLLVAILTARYLFEN